MKTLTQHILEVSSSTLRRAAKKQRAVINRDEFLDGKTARQYVNALRRADAFDAYADLKDEQARIADFKKWLRGTLIYDHNGLQVVSLNNKYSGKTDFNIINSDYDQDTIEDVEFSSNYQHSALDWEGQEKLAKSGLSEKKKETDDDTWGLEEGDSVTHFNIEYGDFAVYYNYGDSPLFCIKDLSLTGGKCSPGPGGSDYFDGGYFGGEYTWRDIESSEDYENDTKSSNLIRSLREPIGEMLTDIANMPFGWNYIYYNDRTFTEVDLKYLQNEICDLYD